LGQKKKNKGALKKSVTGRKRRSAPENYKKRGGQNKREEAFGKEFKKPNDLRGDRFQKA